MKTIHLVLSALMLFIASPLFSQDIISLKDGNSIEVKVIEISINEVKYKKWNNLEGPTYTLKKLELQSITYANGTKEAMQANGDLRREGGAFISQYYSGDQRVDKLTFLNQLKQNQEAYKMYQSGQHIYVTGGILGAGSVLAFGVTYFINVNDKQIIGREPDKYAAAYVTTLTGTAVGMTIFFIGKAKIKKALTKYNTTQSTSLHFDVTQNGLSMVYSF